MNNFNDYKELLFQATEATDKTIYQNFLNMKNHKAQLESQDLHHPFDLLQINENSKDMVELKTRWNYTYEQFDNILVDTYKFNNMLLCKKDNGADRIYVAILYPKSDKIVIVDVTDLDYEYEDLVKKRANGHTISKRIRKVLKTFVPLDIKKKTNEKLNTTTYKYTFPNLKDIYVSTFRRYCSKYGIPQDIIDTEIKKMFNHNASGKNAYAS